MLIQLHTAVINITSDININYEIINANGIIENKFDNNTVYKYSFTTYNGGYYQICTYNNYKLIKTKNKEENTMNSYIYKDNLLFFNNDGDNSKKQKLNIATVFFDLKFGISAKDYSKISKLKELKPVELAVSLSLILN